MKEAASNITTSKWILFVDCCRGEDPEHKVLGREVRVWTHEDNIKKKHKVGTNKQKSQVVLFTSVVTSFKLMPSGCHFKLPELWSHRKHPFISITKDGLLHTRESVNISTTLKNVSGLSLNQARSLGRQSVTTSRYRWALNDLKHAPKHLLEEQFWSWSITFTLQACRILTGI